MLDLSGTDSGDKNAEALFAGGASFVTGVAAISDLPAADRPEIAFAGRSNVGKSSLLTALVKRKKLAYISKTPGRTRQINYFDLAGLLYLVDLPGIGYARAPKTDMKAWAKLRTAYLRGRSSLRRVLVLIDARLGAGPNDEELLACLDKAAVSSQIVLTKADKLKPHERDKALARARKTAAAHPAAHPVPILTSARLRLGLDQLRAELAALIPSP